MGTIRARRQDGSTLEVRTTKKTRHVRLAHESLVWVDLSALGETPALTEISLSYRTALEGLDLGPLARHPSLQSFSATVAGPIDLAPLASCAALRWLRLTVHGDELLDLAPLRGHAALESLALAYEGSQAQLDLSFVRDLPALTSLDIEGGEWRTLDLAPLEGLPLTYLALTRQYISSVDLYRIVQPALRSLMLQDLEIREDYLDLSPLRRCKELQFLSLHGNEVGTLDVGGLAKLEHLQRFDPPNVKSMMMSSDDEPIVAPGLLAWRDEIGID